MIPITFSGNTLWSSMTLCASCKRIIWRVGYFKLINWDYAADSPSAVKKWFWWPLAARPIMSTVFVRGPIPRYCRGKCHQNHRQRRQDRFWYHRPSLSFPYVPLNKSSQSGKPWFLASYSLRGIRKMRATRNHGWLRPWERFLGEDPHSSQIEPKKPPAAQRRGPVRSGDFPDRL